MCERFTDKKASTTSGRRCVLNKGMRSVDIGVARCNLSVQVVEGLIQVSEKQKGSGL